jgi:hypothetical protein
MGGREKGKKSEQDSLPTSGQAGLQVNAGGGGTAAPLEIHWLAAPWHRWVVTANSQRGLAERFRDFSFLETASLLQHEPWPGVVQQAAFGS